MPFPQRNDDCFTLHLSWGGESFRGSIWHLNYNSSLEFIVWADRSRKQCKGFASILICPFPLYGQELETWPSVPIQWTHLLHDPLKLLFHWGQDRALCPWGTVPTWISHPPEFKRCGLPFSPVCSYLGRWPMIPLGKSRGTQGHRYLPCWRTVFAHGVLSSPSVNGLWDWELAQFWKLEKKTFLWGTALLLSILDVFWLYLLYNTLILPTSLAHKNAMICELSLGLTFWSCCSFGDYVQVASAG